ncbi:antibiotic biosynthesis monooxygenase [Sporosarcina sp. FSL W7-1349]|uniref:antibiotic biosynthesis monooxygenase family protein n=1 Tax=Sporosarcina sp. FSL W7-1349 TaxID=2921561 RepID=UPI0030FD18EA
MNIYMTSGTPEFMEKLREKHAKERMFVMHGQGNTILLHETEGKSVFQTPRRFEVIGASGELKENGYFALNNINVMDEGRPVFEHHYKTQQNAVDGEPGFLAFRLLRPLDSDTYVLLTEWSEARFYDLWKESKAYERIHEIDRARVGTDRPHIFTSAPYTATYTAKMKDEEA